MKDTKERGIVIPFDDGRSGSSSLDRLLPGYRWQTGLSIIGGVVDSGQSVRGRLKNDRISSPFEFAAFIAAIKPATSPDEMLKTAE